MTQPVDQTTEAVEVFLLPASYAQQRLWFLEQFAPGSLYNIPFALRLTGRLHTEALQGSLAEIVARHETLRTSFERVDDELMQVIDPEVMVQVEAIDLRGLAEEQREEQAMRLVQEEAHRPFDLQEAPLIRATLLALAEEEHLLLITMHHIISDGWSLGVFTEELTALYQGFVQGEPVMLPELPIQYGDFAEWQRGYLQGEVLEQKLAYWKQQLAGHLPVLQLPTDHPRPAQQTYQGITQSFLVGKELAERLQELSQREGVSLYMTLLAAFKVLLLRYTGQSDLLVGTPIAGRNQGQIEKLIGFFVNTLVMRTDLSDQPTFREVLGRVRKTAFDAYAHQDVPFEKLMEEVQPERNLGHSPLFQVMFSLQNAPMKPWELAGLTVEPVEIKRHSAKFELSFFLWETEDGLAGEVEFNTDLFDVATIERMTGHFVELLESIAEQPDQRVTSLNLLTEAERHLLLVEWNDTGLDHLSGLCMHQHVERQVERTPDAVALVVETERVTYQELNCRANQLAHRLQRLGVGPEVFVGVCMHRSVELVVGLLAILKAGGAYVPLDPVYPPERIAFMMEDAQAPVLLTQERLLPDLPEHQAQVICLDPDGADMAAIAQEGEDNPSSTVTTSNLGYVIYTSGSTGKPKGVAIQHHNASVFIQWARGVYTNEELAGVLFSTSICFDLSVYELFVTLASGGKVILAENALALPTLPARDEVTLINTVPSAIAELLRMEGIPSSVRTVNLAGEPLKQIIVQKLYELPSLEKVYNLYGPSEDTTYSTYTLMPRDLQGAPTIGRPLANTQVYLLDKGMQPVPIGVAGELYIGGDGLARGYLHRPELTAEKFISNPFSAEEGARLYATGDLARYLPDGNIEYLGRIDHQVKIRGFRVELGEIEAALSKHHAVREVVLVAQEEEAGSKCLVAYLSAKLDAELSVSELRAYLKEHLPEYMVPSYFVVLDALPLTPNGKVDRKALPEPERTRSERDRAFVAPRTGMEATVAGIWSDVLRRAGIGAGDHFFELGGHSLLMMSVSSRIRESLGVRVELKELFAYPTVAELAAYLDSKLSTEVIGEQQIQPAPKRDKYPLSHAQKRLWFLYKLDPTSRFYDVPDHVMLHGALDREALEQAFLEMIARHGALRTMFTEIEDVPYQIVLEKCEFVLRCVDLSEVAETERQAVIAAQVGELEQVPFDLTQGPLMRALLFKHGEEQHQLYLNMHHIITDGWSLGLFAREVLAIYDALCQGAEPTLEPVPLQYVDYVEWQERELAEGKLAEQEAYWVDALAKPLPLLELPYDFPRPEVQTYNGDQVLAVLPSELMAGLREVAAEEGMSLYMLLLSGYAMMLHHLSQQNDIIVGTPIAGRDVGVLEQMIGFFVNTLAIRVRFDDVQSGQELMQQVKGLCLHAYQHQTYPFDLLIEKVNPERDMSRTPLFSTMFTLHKQEEPAQGTLRTESLMYEAFTTSKFDLSLTVLEGAQETQALFLYNTDLFQRSTMSRFMNLYVQVLQTLVTSRTAPIVSLDLLTAEDQKVIREMHSQSERVSGRLLLDQFVEMAKQHPERIALSDEGTLVTYGELDARSNQVAHLLRAQGVQPNQFVAIMLERSVEMLVGLYGILKSGAAYVPIDPEYPAERIRYMLSDSGAEIMLTKEAYLESVLEIAEESGNLKTLVVLDGRAVDMTDDVTVHTDTSASRSEQPVRLFTATHLNYLPTTLPTTINNWEDIAYIIYTSGSTGQPKGVRVPHRAIVHALASMQERFKLTEADVFALRSSFCFDSSLWELFWSLQVGARVAILSSEVVGDPYRLHEQLNREEVTFINFVPSLFTVFVSALEQLEPAERLLPSLRYVLTGGEALMVKPVQLWFNLFAAEHRARLFNLYGPTETAIQATVYELETEPERSIPIGKPFPNLQLFVLNPAGQICPLGVAGELHIGGAQLAEGYHNKPDKTAEAFIPNHLPAVTSDRLYKTGDLVRLLADGNLEFIGRIDGQVKVRGYRIETGEIEHQILKYPDVEQAAVIVEKGPDDNNLLVAIFTSLATLNVSHLKSYLAEQMPAYMVPSRIMQIEVMPLTPTGKIDRKALATWAAKVAQEIPSTSGTQATETEEKLMKIWSLVLKRDRVGIHDNFFDMGGHSLLAMSVFSQISREFGITLPLRTIFACPTIAGLAVLVEEQIGGDHALEVIPKAPQQEHYTLSHAQKRLWFFYKLEPNSSMYNVPGHFKLHGELKRDVFELSLQFMVARHSALRTVFLEIDGMPRQQVKEGIDFTPLYEDLSRLDAEKRASVLHERIFTSESVAFDLTQGPLLRAMLFKCAEDEHDLYLNMHHIITDGWSFDIFTRELFAVYNSLAEGAPLQLTALPIHYVDFAEWQAGRAAQGAWAQEEAYWLETLGGTLPVLNLPLDAPRPEVQTYEGALASTMLSRRLTEQLRRTAKGQGVSLFMLMLAGYNLLLNQLTGEEDLIVGVPIAGRSGADLDALCGFFVNTLAIRTRLTGVATLHDLLQRVKTQSLDAYQHQSYPFDLLIEKLNPERDMSRSPVISTLFSFINFTGTQQDEEAGSLRIEPLAGAHTTSKMDLSLIVSEDADHLHLAFEYNTDLFRSETIAKFTEMLQRGLQALVSQLDTPLAEVALLTEADQQAYISLNQTATDFASEETIVGRFEAVVNRFPQQIALSDDYTELTYSELNKRANQVAHALVDHGMQKGEFVAIVMERSLETVISILGVMKAGGAYVPIDLDYPEERIRYMLQDSGAPYVLTRALHLVELQHLDSVRTVLAVDDAMDEYATGNLDQEILASDVAYMIYTSGSTGQPKGTMLRHRGVVNLATWFVNHYGYSERDTVLAFASYSFDASVWETFGTLLSGARLHQLSQEQRQSIGEFVEVVARTSATSSVIPNVFFKQLAAYLSAEQVAKMATLKRLFVGGEALMGEDVRLWQRRFGTDVHICNAYGPTEATVLTAVYDVTDFVEEEVATIPIGKPLPNYEVYILNKQLQLCPVGVTGEICIGGVGLATGYLNQPDKTSDVFIPHPFSAEPGARLYRSGDLGRLLPNGDIECLGRADSQVKIRGFRIEIGEIEAMLLQHPDVEVAAVLTKKASSGNTMLAAYYTTTEEQSLLDSNELRRFLTAKLPDYMVPAHIIHMATMPLTPNGKVDRKVLEGLVADLTPDQARTFEAATTSLQGQIVEVWEQCVRYAPIGIQDNFFQIGGDSIIAMQVVARLNERGLVVKTKDLFKHQTIAELARFVEHNGLVATTAAGRLEEEERTILGEVPLSAMQQWIFDQHYEMIDREVSGLFLDISREINPHFLQKAISHLVDHHDILRAHYVQEGAEIKQIILSSQEVRVELELLDFSGFDRDWVDEKLREIDTQLLTTLRIDQAPLMKVVLVRYGHAEYSLRWVIHHLLVDGYSVRVLMNDLIDVYQQVEQGGTVKMSAKTASFARWVESNRAYVNSERGLELVKAWQPLLEEMQAIGDNFQIPVDFEGGSNRYCDLDSVLIEFDEATTSRLLHGIDHGQGVTFKDRLITLVMRSLAKWTGQEQVILNLHGHGRDVLDDSLHMDLTKTVGWFADRMPFAAQVDVSKPIDETAIELAAKLRALPQEGSSFPMLRSYLEDEAVREMFASLYPEIVLNFIGQTDNASGAESAWQWANPHTEGMRREDDFFFKLMIEGMIDRGRLMIGFTHSKYLYQQGTIQRLADLFQAEVCQFTEVDSISSNER